MLFVREEEGIATVDKISFDVVIVAKYIQPYIIWYQVKMVVH